VSVDKRGKSRNRRLADQEVNAGKKRKKRDKLRIEELEAEEELDWFLEEDDGIYEVR